MPSSVLISIIHAQQAALHDIHLPHDDFSQIHLHVSCGVVHELRVCEVLPITSGGPKNKNGLLMVKSAGEMCWAFSSVKMMRNEYQHVQIQDEENPPYLPTVSHRMQLSSFPVFSHGTFVYLMSIIGEPFGKRGDVSYTTCENNNIIDTHDRYVHVSPTRTISEVSCPV